MQDESTFHSRGITDALFWQGPCDESMRYRDVMGWDMPWYSPQYTLDAFLVGRQIGLFHLVCYPRVGDRVFETHRITCRGVEAPDESCGLMHLIAYGRQESWEDSPPGWPPVSAWPGGLPIAQWSRLEAGVVVPVGRAGR